MKNTSLAMENRTVMIDWDDCQAVGIQDNGPTSTTTEMSNVKGVGQSDPSVQSHRTSFTQEIVNRRGHRSAPMLQIDPHLDRQQAPSAELTSSVELIFEHPLRSLCIQHSTEEVRID